MGKYAGLRIDIDCVRDAESLPVLLDMLNRHGIKATFFAATGPDNIARNMTNNINPLNIIRKKAFKRYGRTIFNGLLFKRQVQESKNIGLILDAGHELGLHGYDHYNWMNHLDSKKHRRAKCFDFTWLRAVRAGIWVLSKIICIPRVYGELKVSKSAG